ncbi:MAG TPA: hypothetical protein VG603_01575, partial [Chitinophagales bacterium]|nr:hypothetical protein [Chitinophagales bacterium]
MFKRNIFLIGVFLLPFLGYSQAYNDMGPADNFQTASNPYYWKNKKPFEGYWQQDIHYTIKANIDETTDVITGQEHLAYTNNSPDTLYFVYFNLYQNAFTPKAYLDNLQLNNGERPTYGKYERAGLGTTIDEIKSG